MHGCVGSQRRHSRLPSPPRWRRPAGSKNILTLAPGVKDEDGDGLWTLTVTLQPGVYQYNLLVDGTRWVKDPAADAFRPDGFGGVNSVLRL